MATREQLMSKLYKLDGAVKRDYDPYAHVIEPVSPSLAYLFDNSWGLPFGYTCLLWGEQKGGKSLIARMMVGALHKQDPEAVALYYNTEMREELQATPAQLATFGIDPNRYIAFDVNEPGLIFDPIETEVPKLIEEGLNIKLIVIDSITDILGLKMMNADSVTQQLMGDKAQTQANGLDRIKGVLRRNRIACILTAQARAEMDMHEQMRGKKIKMAAAWAVKHKAEYFIMVEHLKTAEGKKDLLGNSFQDKNIANIMSSAKDGEFDIAGRKIRCTMEQSSCGRDGRVGIFTLHKDLGLINTHEEVFLLGKAFGAIEEPTQGHFQFGERKWHGKEAILSSLKEDSTLRGNILAACKHIDLNRKGIPFAGIEDPGNVQDNKDA